MHTRERLVAIEPRVTVLLATTLRTRDEVMNVAEALEGIPTGKPDKEMIIIAQKIIEQKEGEFDPEQFTDRYEDALRALSEEKKRGHKITRVEEPEDTTNFVDHDRLEEEPAGGSRPAAKKDEWLGLSKLPKLKSKR